MNNREGYTIQIWNNMTGEWDTSTYMWNRRYNVVRKEFDALCQDAKKAEHLRKFRIINTASNIVYDSFSNR